MKTRFTSNAKICGICLSEIGIQGVINSCCHEFCFNCISKWSDIENKCPVCKATFLKITSEFQRKQYRSVKMKKKVNYVNHKTQKCNLNLLALIETAEQILTHEFYQLLTPLRYDL
ncbi:hypothetical protein SteCoe_1797 [Stentor coeruleus]|uniref:RING-type domain-containing protein n=1 Tax=Stentor coeruleus TaxID=5963 RepID=A0A1R2D0Z3_9CILI|nr:hypothetical protein SteCoe_1797 [Stentor coeruleus]